MLVVRIEGFLRQEFDHWYLLGRALTQLEEK